MRIKIISDIFVDEQNKIDGKFYHSDETFIDYLKKSMVNYTYVIINGNFLNCWKSDFILQKLKAHNISKSRHLLYNFIKNNLAECNYKIKYITDCIKPTKNLIYVSGNNDVVCEDIFKGFICKAVIVSLFDKNIYISHGHQAYFNTNTTCLGKKISKCFGIFGLIDDDLDNNFSNLELTLIPKEDKVYEDHALKMATLYNYNVVIYGHTLNGYCTVLKNGTIYANTGSISGKNYSYDEVLVNLDPELLEVLFRNIDATYKVLKSDQKTIPKVHPDKFNKLITYI